MAAISTERAPKFASKSASPLALDLERAVAGYFAARGLSQKANPAMVRKTLIILASTLASYALIVAPIHAIPWLVRLAGCIVLGLGYGGMGMAIGHDALHGAYAEKPWVNRFLSRTFDLMGANSYIWRYTHNIAHHTYSNIEGYDPDIDYAPLLRMSPGAPRLPIHRFQAVYAFVLYSLAGLHWFFVKDLGNLQRRQLGPYTNLRHPWTAWLGFFLWRLGSLIYLVAIPIYLLRPSWWQFALGFLTVYLVAGTTMALVFQLAHAVKGPATAMLPAPHTGQLSDDFLAHQIRTTADFGCRNPLLTWYVGGLNFQIEHHLFPQICSTHYPALHPLIREIALRHGLPFHEFKSMRSALASHIGHLWQMGRKISQQPEPV